MVLSPGGQLIQLQGVRVGSSFNIRSMGRNLLEKLVRKSIEPETPLESF